MAIVAEILRGVEQFGRIGDSSSGDIHPIGEAIWLARRAAEEDRALLGLEGHPLAGLRQYFLRLREMGSIFAEVFAFQEYTWEPKSDNPRIIDLGGDIGGFAVLYWKSVAPNARVTLVEANPATATVVSDNLRRKGMRDVKVINAAVSEYGEPTELHLSGYNPSNFVGERIGLDHSAYRAISVPGVKLSELIGDERVDLLKMDIEGVEGGVLRELAATGKLDLIDEIMMEFHNDPSNPTNSLQETLQILHDAGFTIENPHISGIQRLRRLKGQRVDIELIKPSDTVLFAFTAKRN